MADRSARQATAYPYPNATAVLTALLKTVCRTPDQIDRCQKAVERALQLAEREFIAARGRNEQRPPSIDGPARTETEVGTVDKLGHSHGVVLPALGTHPKPLPPSASEQSVLQSNASAAPTPSQFPRKEMQNGSTPHPRPQPQTVHQPEQRPQMSVLRLPSAEVSSKVASGGALQQQLATAHQKLSEQKEHLEMIEKQDGVIIRREVERRREAENKLREARALIDRLLDELEVVSGGGGAAPLDDRLQRLSTIVSGIPYNGDPPGTPADLLGSGTGTEKSPKEEQSVAAVSPTGAAQPFDGNVRLDEQLGFSLGSAPVSSGPADGWRAGAGGVKHRRAPDHNSRLPRQGMLQRPEIVDGRPALLAAMGQPVEPLDS